MTSDPAHKQFTVLENVHVLDPLSGAISERTHVTIENGLIVSVENDAPALGGHHFDLTGLTIMPGLIDCHVHVAACTTDPAVDAVMSPSYVAAWAAQSLRGMLMRGFTTVRDVGGGDFGLAGALRDGMMVGPRLLFGGPALSQTGGHGDDRGPGQYAHEETLRFPAPAVVCDGEAEVRRAARHILRTGADHIKMMVSGGIASPTDRLESTQFSVAEIEAVVDEAQAAHRYVAGHAYSPPAIQRALEAGVRSIEHGSLLDDANIQHFLRKDAFLVPTLSTYRALADEGKAWGLSSTYAEKLGNQVELGMAALERADRAGVQIAFGTDLLSGMQRRQCEEFELRAEVQSPISVIQAATVNAARLVRLETRIGQVQPGFEADLIAVDGNPLESLESLTKPDIHLKLVMRSGEVCFHAG